MGRVERDGKVLSASAEERAAKGSGLSKRGSAAALLIFALGFFALVAQSLLFRSFLGVFEGSELGIGCFFGSWLLWVGAGALAGRGGTRFHKWLARHFEWLALLYIPAFLVQRGLIAHARAIAGVRPDEVFPFLRMAGVSLLVNAPISAATGLLFTLACRWATRVEKADSRSGTPVAWVYITETLGGCAGGVAVTLLLAAGASAERVALCAAGLLTAALAVSRLARPRGFLARALPLIPVAIIAASLVIGVDAKWAARADLAVWERLLPREAFRGSFSTAHAKYLYGEREGQWMVVSSGGVCEALPNTEHASEVAALNLAQRPESRRVLVIGPGSLGISLRLLELPQMERVVWLHPDLDYPKALLDALPAGYARGADRLELPGVEVRRFLAREPGALDLVLVNLPDVTTLVLNRYATQSFYAAVKQALAPGGAVAVRVSGGANFLGSELVDLGASGLVTLHSVFPEVALKPGDESWFIASETPLTQSPDVLRARFAAIPGAAARYPPEALAGLYLPDRVAFQMGHYRDAAATMGKTRLLNTDQRPKALLYALLLAIRQAGMGHITPYLPAVMGRGLGLGLFALLLYVVLRLVYLRRTPHRRGDVQAPPARPFDVGVMVFTMGMAGMALNVVLMFLYQARFGSIFLHIGLISALFMLGSFAGGLFGERVLRRRETEPGLLLPAAILLHVLLIIAASSLPEALPRPTFALLFGLCGVFTGVYFPIGAHRLAATGQAAAASGSTLETLDHLGGASGALLTGLFLLPVLGGSVALELLAALVAVNLVGMAASKGRPARMDTYDHAARTAGYILFGAAALLLVLSHVLAETRAAAAADPLTSAAQALAGDAELKEREMPRPDGTTLRYFAVDQAEDKDPGYIFPSAPFAGEVDGYGGPIDLAIHMDAQGTLLGFLIIQSNETPAYLKLLRGWLARLPGKSITGRGALAGVDTVSGATITSAAMLRILGQAGNSFAAEVLGRGGAGGTEPRAPIRFPDKEFLWLAALTAAAVALRYKPNKWLRRAFLVAIVAIAGVYLNLQYSAQHVYSLLGAAVPGDLLSGPFFLVALVPLIVLVFGNVYCGYLCPFGALQELVGEFRPARLAAGPDERSWRYARAVKYLLLFTAAAAFAVFRDCGLISADPLTTFFSSVRTRPILILGLAMLVLSVFYRRFWCRNLCPAGAFLALLNGVRLLQRFMPRIRPARCDLGVRSHRELDCIQCDRCAVARPRASAEPSRALRIGLYAAVAVTVLALLGMTLGPSHNAPGSQLPQSDGARTGVAGQVRDIDDAEFRRLIREGVLSGHEADFYTSLPADTPDTEPK